MTVTGPCPKLRAELTVTRVVAPVSNPVMSSKTLEDWVSDAVAGDAAALEHVVRQIKDDIYGLAMRMLFHPADAEDATQEVLLRVVTRLSRFEGRSRFRTWVYRVAVRALLNVRRGRAEPPAASFEDFGDDLMDGLQAGAPGDLAAVEVDVLTREVRIACTQAMLMCLDRDHRIAYLLGVVFGLDGPEAARAMDVSEATYRKRLSRARQRVETFTRSHCSLVAPVAPCSCAGRIGPAVTLGRVDPAQLLFAAHPVNEVTTETTEQLVSILKRAAHSDTLMQSNPAYVAPERLVARVRQGLAAGG